MYDHGFIRAVKMVKITFTSANLKPRKVIEHVLAKQSTIQ